MLAFTVMFGADVTKFKGDDLNKFDVINAQIISCALCRVHGLSGNLWQPAGAAGARPGHILSWGQTYGHSSKPCPEAEAQLLDMLLGNTFHGCCVEVGWGHFAASWVLMWYIVEKGRKKSSGGCQGERHSNSLIFKLWICFCRLTITFPTFWFHQPGPCLAGCIRLPQAWTDVMAGGHGRLLFERGLNQFPPLPSPVLLQF